VISLEGHFSRFGRGSRQNGRVFHRSDSLDVPASEVSRLKSETPPVCARGAFPEVPQAPTPGVPPDGQRSTLPRF